MKQMTRDEINAAIKSIGNRGAKLDADIQTTALNILAHIEAHKEVSLFNKLWFAMPKGARKTALAKWGMAFGKLEANAGEDKKEQPFKYSRDKQTNMAEAAQNPWFDFAPEKQPDELFDVRAVLAVLVRKMDKAQSLKEPELATSLRAFVAGLESAE